MTGRIEEYFGTTDPSIINEHISMFQTLHRLMIVTKKIAETAANIQRDPDAKHALNEIGLQIDNAIHDAAIEYHLKKLRETLP